MQEFFDEDEHRSTERRRDTELTLGPMLLLCLFFGLVLLCGLCFGLGYSMGSHSARNAPASGQQSGADASSPTAGSPLKPPATAQYIAQQPHPSSVDLSPSDALESSPSAASQPPDSTAAVGANSAQPTVKPALPATATPAFAQTAPALPAPAMRVAPTSALMVQIALFPRQEDADVLVGALRKRGYAVTVVREIADNLFHVRTGPFNSRGDALAMRQKLLNDGYNAVVQP
jgi:cell division septation protein DedD